MKLRSTEVLIGIHFLLGLVFGEHTEVSIYLEAQKGLHEKNEVKVRFFLNKVYRLRGLFTLKWLFKSQEKNEDFVTLFWVTS